jgi:hypothetical protein
LTPRAPPGGHGVFRLRRGFASESLAPLKMTAQVYFEVQ